MVKQNQNGGIALVVSDVLLIIALIAALGFGYWAYQGRQDYKDNVDAKIKDAVTKAQSDQSAKDNQIFAEKEKLPNKTFKGPATYGSISFSYAKTWSGYVDQTNINNPIRAFFYPDLVPSSSGQPGSTTYALRVDLIGTTYSQVVKQFDTFIKQGLVKAKAYIPPQMVQIPNVQTGTRFDGQIERGVSGSMVVIKVRDKTLQIYTEAPKFLNDFNNTVLKSLTFVP